MLKKACSALGLAVLLGFASCSDDNPWLEEAGMGAIRLNLTSDGTIEDVIPQTRADGSDYFETPTANQFNVHLIKPDGQIHTDLPHDDFIRKSGFPGGTYTLKVFSGNPDEEGYDVRPYFEGSTRITVLEGTETEASVHATLGHTLVSVTYTDAFKAYMQSYSANLHSAGHKYIDVPEGESRPAFLVPGEVSLTLDFTDPQGRQLTLHPAEFKAEAAKHYQIELNVNNGEVGAAKLEISFLGVKEKETVTIDLSDELFSAPEPEVKPVGFSDNGEMEFLAGEKANEKCSFTVLSYGGLKNVTLTFNKLEGQYDSPFNNEINLIGASETVQAQLQRAGIDCTGVFRNPDKMAKIDLSRLPEMLPAGKYQVSVLATDMLARSSQPVTVFITVRNSTITVEPIEANTVSNVGTLRVTYNGSNPTSDLSFKADNEYGMKVDAPILSCTKATRSIVENTYDITIRLSKIGEYSFNRGAVEIEARLNGNYAGTYDLPIITSFQPDAFATKVLLKPVCLEEKVQGVLNGAQVTVYKNGQEVTGTTVSKNTQYGIITVTGLEPNTSYTFTVTGYEGSNTFEGSFTTENNTDIANGNFQDTQLSLSFTDVNVGGTYKSGSSLWPYTYQNTVDIVRSTPAGWGNINDITCADVAGLEKNTWYMVPSTFIEDGKVTVRTVGYNNERRAAIEQSKSSLTRPYQYYCMNAPAASDLKIAAGELYLGEGADKRTSFSTRPSNVTFEYSFTPYKNETAKAEVIVYSGAEVIGTKSMTLDGSSSTGTLALTYGLETFGKKATHLAIIFKSSSASNPEIYIPSGKDELKDGEWGTPDNRKLADNEYKAYAKGSVLVINNVKLNY